MHIDPLSVLSSALLPSAKRVSWSRLWKRRTRASMERVGPRESGIGAILWSAVCGIRWPLRVACALACILATSAGPALGESSPSEIRKARLAAERDAQRRPGSGDAQVRLAEAYYKSARDAFDRHGDEARYLLYLGRSVDACVKATRIDRTDHRPHFYLALIDSYRGKLREALRGFCRVESLQPSGIAKTNIAEIYIYLGDFDAARAWNQRGLAAGAGAGPVGFNEMLLDWKEGDLAGARRLFRQLRTKHPDMMQTINAARLPVAISSFEEFTEYCCGSPACGPYMGEACGRAGFEVEQRQISEKGQREELRIQTKRDSELGGIYAGRDDLRFCVGPDAAK